MGSEELENLIGMMSFHTSAAVTLAKGLAENCTEDERDMISSVLQNTASDSTHVIEHAFWETLRDFFLPEPEDTRSVEGDNIVDIMRKDH